MSYLPVDKLGYSPADVALSLNSAAIYSVIQSHGVRSEFLLTLLASKEQESSNLVLKDAEEDTLAGNTAKFLQSKLTYDKDDEGRERVIDEEGNGVMMGG
jgi:type IV protein arginine methyltransferase